MWNNIFSRARNIYCSLTRFEKRPPKHLFLLLRWYIQPPVRLIHLSLVYIGTRVVDLSFGVHIIYIHTHICNIVIIASISQTEFTLSRCLPTSFSIGNESDGEKRRWESQESRALPPASLSVAFSRFLLTLKFQSSHCAEWPAEKRASKSYSQIHYNRSLTHDTK